MSNLNLSSDKTTDQGTHNYFGGGALISFFILICTLVLYGALQFLNKDTSSKIEATKAKFQAEFNSFIADGNASAVADFNNRSLQSKDLMKNEKRGSEVLGKIEGTILPAVHLNSLEYDKEKNSLILSCVGDNFNTVAKQILSFKDSGYFSEVVPGESSVNTEGSGLTFEITLTLK